MKVLGEDETLEIALGGRSISRVGEGELKLAVRGWSIKSQAHDSKLAAEIRAVMQEPGPALACLPRIYKGIPNEPFWRNFENPAFRAHYRLTEYGSAFITRPDVAPNIDRPDYWEKARRLWAGRDVTLIAPALKTLPMPEAASVRLVQCPPVQAWAAVDRIEEEVGRPAGPILICAGATATALAARLARKGLWAIDIGHMGHFMGAAGAWSVGREALISPGHLERSRKLLKTGGYAGGRRYAEDVLAFARELGAYGMVDYGAGKGTLKKALAADFAGPIEEYDPAVPGIDRLPKPADLIVCAEVLEHVEPDRLDAVVSHIHRLAKKGAFFAVATRPAKDETWWLKALERPGWRVERQAGDGGVLKVWVAVE